MPTQNKRKVSYKMNPYKDIMVSPQNVDFSEVSVTDAPREFYADWFDLVVRIARAIHPPFEVPAFPETIEFKSNNYETNPITEVYYFIESKIFTVKGAGGYGVEFRSHKGFHQFDGNDCVEMEATGLPRDYTNRKSVSQRSGVDMTPPLGKKSVMLKYTLKEKQSEQGEDFTIYAHLIVENGKVVGAWRTDSSSSEPEIYSFDKK